MYEIEVVPYTNCLTRNEKLLKNITQPQPHVPVEMACGEYHMRGVWLAL